MNRWNIPDWLEREVAERDRQCVYCGVELNGQDENRRNRPSWEHIINDARIITRENIARCCMGCNASKGTKDLVDWLRSRYCTNRGITHESVASVVQVALGSKLTRNDSPEIDRSADRIAKLAAEALKEHRKGRTKPLDPDRL